MKTYLLLASLIVLWLSLGFIAIKYDYKSQPGKPDKPGINCINLDNPSIWPVPLSSTNL
jgi:hypothetical protein